MPSPYPEAASPTALETFLFDLNGFIVVRQALAPAHLAACNGIVDSLQYLRRDEWAGWIQGHDYGGKEGLNLQQIYESGPAFESLIDHPAWIEKVRTFVGGEGTFDNHHGPLFIDENFANIRKPGEAIGLHSGGQDAVVRCQFRVKDQRFHCGQVNVLLALNDIGTGDGATMVVPGSHKSNFPHPELERARMKGAGTMTSVDGVTGAVEVHLQAGDAIIFVDAIMHGAAARVNPGQRRIYVSRYGVSWGINRHGFQPSPELISRLTPNRRKIVQPMAHHLPPCAHAPLLATAPA